MRWWLLGVVVFAACERSASSDEQPAKPAIDLAELNPSEPPREVDGVRCKTRGKDAWFASERDAHCAASQGATIVLVVDGKEVRYDLGQQFQTMTKNQLFEKRYGVHYNTPDGRRLVVNNVLEVLASWLRGVAMGIAPRTSFAPRADDSSPLGRFVALVQATHEVRVSDNNRPLLELAVVGATEAINERASPGCPMRDKLDRVVQLGIVLFDAKVTAINTATGATTTKEFPSSGECPTSTFVEQDLAGHVKTPSVRVGPDWSVVMAWLATL